MNTPSLRDDEDVPGSILPVFIPDEAQVAGRSALELTSRAAVLTVATRSEFLSAAGVLRDIKRYETALEEKRTAVTKPLNEALRTVNNWFRGFSDALKSAEARVKLCMAGFQEAEAQAIAEAPPDMPEIAPVAAAGIGFGSKWEFNVVDPMLVPREFLMVDEKKIGQYVRAMKETAVIPGVRIFKTTKVIASTR
jgi:hypothetical protein